MQLNNGERLLAWPLEQHVITAGWTYNDGSAHNAIDLRAATGTPVYAAESGTVILAQPNWNGLKTGVNAYGKYIRISHANYRGKSLETTYAHLSQVLVKYGDKVTEGQLIGFSGNTGNSTGPHLHFEVRLASGRSNPLYWLDGDFTCANSTVAKHLGVYKSVERPDDAPKTELCSIKTKPMSPGDVKTVSELLESLAVGYDIIKGE